MPTYYPSYLIEPLLLLLLLLLLLILFWDILFGFGFFIYLFTYAFFLFFVVAALGNFVFREASIDYIRDFASLPFA